jgi:hypothetical protein
MKLTLRDLLWLALLVASLTAWGLQYARTTEQLSKRRWILREDFGPSDAAKQRRAALAKFASYSDQELDDQLSALSQNTTRRYGPDYEPCLTEMARRELTDRLQKHYDALLARDKSKESFWHNVELLTALRRAQKRPDPLRIQVSVVPSLVGKAEPMIHATITNVDVGQESVQLKHGGDYRGGRLERWRIELTDEQGRRVRDSNFFPGMGGGIFSVGPLKPGETERYPAKMDLRDYVAPPRSGKYSLRVVYHNDLCIADETDIAGLIVMRSEPITVFIQNDNDPFQGVQSGNQMALAIVAACGIMLLVARMSGVRTAPVTAVNALESHPHLRRTLPRRDLWWCGMLLLIAAGLWIHYHWQVRAMRGNDSNARWWITGSRVTPLPKTVRPKSPHVAEKMVVRRVEDVGLNEIIAKVRPDDPEREVKIAYLTLIAALIAKDSATYSTFIMEGGLQDGARHRSKEETLKNFQSSIAKRPYEDLQLSDVIDLSKLEVSTLSAKRRSVRCTPLVVHHKGQALFDDPIVLVLEKAPSGRWMLVEGD